MKKLLFLFWVMLGISCNQQHAGAQSSLAPNEFEAKMQGSTDGQILDVRTPEEFKEGHLKGAVNINFYDDDFAQQAAKLDKNKPVFVYCAMGGRSASAAGQMAKSGFTSIFDLKGGITAWKKAGKPVVTE